MKKHFLRGIKLSLTLASVLSGAFLYAGETPSPTRGAVIAPSAKTSATLVSAKRSSAFTLTDSSPTRIITPNADGVNDSFILSFDNETAGIVSQAKIYDLSGNEVADMAENTPSGSLIMVLSWNGRDKNGEYARSGIYIYQVQSEGKVTNGTLVVAR